MTVTEMLLSKKALKVSEIMHEYPICCMETDTVQHAAELMKENHVGALPVVKQGTRGKIIGVVTDRDLCLRVIAEARDALKAKVSECMTMAPVCCLENDPVERALELMHDYHVRRIPVVDAEGRVCGIISFANLVMNHVAPTEIFNMLRAVSVPTPEAIQCHCSKA
jgi:CBS domain-containing protein